MSDQKALRQLRDYPVVDDLEHKSVLNSDLLAPAALAEPDTGIAAAIQVLFGIEIRAFGRWLGEASAAERRPYSTIPDTDTEVVGFFAKLGWDVTDQQGKPLRMLYHFVLPLFAAIRGDAGASLPGAPLSRTEDWAAAMERDVRKFKPKRS